MSLSARRAWIEIGINPDQSGKTESLSARRAWIEIGIVQLVALAFEVALRKESVDRNEQLIDTSKDIIKSLSARRAWIEMALHHIFELFAERRSPQGERG